MLHFADTFLCFRAAIGDIENLRGFKLDRLYYGTSFYLSALKFFLSTLSLVLYLVSNYKDT